MRRILRCAFVAVLSLALCAPGATLGLAPMAAPGKSGEHSHHGATHAEHEHHAQHTAAQTSSDEDAQQTSDHPSKNCCSACTVVSPLPPTPETTVELIASQTVYSSPKRLDAPVAMPIDPGIPKRMG